MKILFTLLFIFTGGFLLAQDSAQLNKESLAVEQYPGGMTFSFGTVISKNVGLDLKHSVLIGRDRVKIGYNIAYTSLYFNDTLTDAKGSLVEPNRRINSLGVGVTSRVYSKSAFGYFSSSANYVMALDDKRFGATSGLNFRLALGIYHNLDANACLFFEAGPSLTSYLTNTTERPTNVGFVFNLGVTL